MGSWRITIPIELDLAPPPELGWTYLVGVALSVLVGGGVVLCGVFAVLWLLEAWRSSRGVPLDAGRYPQTHALLSSASGWRSASAAQLRSRSRTALARVFGASWWRTFATERAVRGRWSFGVDADDLRASVAVYLDAAVQAER